MKHLRASSVGGRLAQAAFALWFAAATGIILFNRYQYGADLDSVADLVLVGIAVPVAIAAVAYACWTLGRVGTSLLSIAVFAALAVLGVTHLYSAHKRQLAAERQAAERSERIAEMERRFGEACARTSGGEREAYDFCIYARDIEERRSNAR